MSAARGDNTPSAFTLLEMLVVLVLIGALAAVVAVRLTGQLKQAEDQKLHARIADFDQQTRRAAERLGQPLELRFALAEEKLRRRRVDQREALGTRGELTLPGDVQIAEILVAREELSRQAVEAGIRISRGGRSPSYAYSLVGPGDSTQWFVMIGFTGETFEVANQDQARRLLLGPGDDAR